MNKGWPKRTMSFYSLKVLSSLFYSEYTQLFQMSPSNNLKVRFVQCITSIFKFLKHDILSGVLLKQNRRKISDIQHFAGLTQSSTQSSTKLKKGYHSQPLTHQTPDTSNPKTHQTTDKEYRAVNYTKNKNAFFII